MNYSTVEEIRNQYASKKISEEDIVTQINLFLENNSLDKAYLYLRFLAGLENCTESILMTAGLVALSQQEKSEARKYFEKIIILNRAHYDAQYNVALLEMEDGNLEKARDRLKILIEHYPDNADLYNDLAIIYSQLDNVEEAYASWEESLKRNPNDSKNRNNALEYTLHHGFFDEGLHILTINRRADDISDKTEIELKRWSEILEERSLADKKRVKNVINNIDTRISGQKIAIFASIDTFIKEIAQSLAEDNEVRFYKNSSKQEMKSLMEWADVSWFEWCDQLVIEATKLKKTCKIVCRLHSYEAFTEMPMLVDWGKVDVLIFVNASVQKIIQEKYNLTVEQVVVQNGLDVHKYVIPGDKIYTKKIASVGYINYKKNPSLLLYCFDKIHSFDNEYTLHIAGKHQDPRIELYFKHYLKNNPLPIYFDGWVEDMASWYADKDYVISTSLFESFHYSIAEGMASGLLPLIHNWFGADMLYPQEYLFRTPDDCLRLLQKLETADKKVLAINNHQFITDRFNQKSKLDEIYLVLQKVLTKETVSG